MSTGPDDSKNIVSDYYEGYKQTQAEIAAQESRRVRNSIFTVAALLLANDMLALAIADLFSAESILYSLIIPLVLVGVGLLAIKQPLVAISLAALVFTGLIVWGIVLYGGVGAITGILIKAVIIYFILAGFQSARHAEKARKELKN